MWPLVAGTAFAGASIFHLSTVAIAHLLVRQFRNLGINTRSSVVWLSSVGVSAMWSTGYLDKQILLGMCI